MIKEVYITTFTIDIIIDGSRNVWVIRIIENSEDKKKNVIIVMMLTMFPFTISGHIIFLKHFLNYYYFVETYFSGTAIFRRQLPLFSVEPPLYT